MSCHEAKSILKGYHGWTYGETAQGEDAREDQFLLEGELGLKKDGHWDEDNHYVGGDVEDGVGDEVIGSCRTLSFTLQC